MRFRVRFSQILCAVFLLFMLVLNASALPIQLDFTAQVIQVSRSGIGTGGLQIGNEFHWTTFYDQTEEGLLNQMTSSTTHYGDGFLGWLAESQNIMPGPGLENGNIYGSNLFNSINYTYVDAVRDDHLVELGDRRALFVYEFTNVIGLYDAFYGGRMSNGVGFLTLVDGRYNFSRVDFRITQILGDMVIVNTPPGPAPVPEPATMLLLGSGIVGFCGFGRKKKAKI